MSPLRDSRKTIRQRGLRHEAGAAPLLFPYRSADPDLAALIDAWPTLPDAIRAGIMAMVRSSAESGRRRVKSPTRG